MSANRDIYERVFIECLKEHNDLQPKYTSTLQRNPSLVPKEPIFGPKFSIVQNASLMRDFTGSAPTHSEPEPKPAKLASAPQSKEPVVQINQNQDLPREQQPQQQAHQKQQQQQQHQGVQKTRSFLGRLFSGGSGAQKVTVNKSVQSNNFAGLVSSKINSNQNQRSLPGQKSATSSDPSDPSLKGSASNPKLAAQLIADWQKFKQVQATSSTNEQLANNTTGSNKQQATALVGANKKLQQATGGGQTHNKDSAPSVSHAPNAVLGPSSIAGGAKAKAKVGKTHASLAKTIADQTPDAFKTLGPGFNRGPEVSLRGKGSNTSTTSAQLSTIPSDYEHIFHAPSDMLGNHDATQSTAEHQKKPTQPAATTNDHRKQKKRTNNRQKQTQQAKKRGK